MISTFQAVAVTLFALLPGALYTWAFEKETGAWGLGLADRFLRFVGVSAVFHAILAPLTYHIYRRLIMTGDVVHGRQLPVWAWAIPPLFILLPTALGSWVGTATHARRGWARLITGPSPAPRAWDHLFTSPDLTGWVFVYPKDGLEPLVGTYAGPEGDLPGSYAAGYPEAQDLFLGDTAEYDSATGQLQKDDNGQIKMRGVSVLIRWDEIAYLEFLPA